MAAEDRAPEDAATAHLRAAGFAGPYDLAIVTGTGLGALVEAVEDRVSLAYAAIHSPRIASLSPPELPGAQAL